MSNCRRRRPRLAVTDTGVAHALMAIAMAGMLARGLATLPNVAWEVVFGVLTAWFAYRVAMDARAGGVRALAGGHLAPHLMHCAAMLYMFLALATRGAGGGAMGGTPGLAAAFALVLVGYSVWDADRLSGRRRTPAHVAVASPAGATVCCRIAMGVTMAAMLVVMI